MLGWVDVGVGWVLGLVGVGWGGVGVGGCWGGVGVGVGWVLRWMDSESRSPLRQIYNNFQKESGRQAWKIA